MNPNDKLKSLQKQNGLAGFKVDLWNYEGEKGALIPLLQAAQDTYGFIPASAIDQISEIVGIPAAEIYGVITFYSQFRLHPVGKNMITACCGTACHVRGAERILNNMKRELGLAEDEDTTPDKEFTVEKVACLGFCSFAPVVLIDRNVHGKANAEPLLKEIRSLRKK